MRCCCLQTAAEIEEYCRDPDSSGCDLDMMDALMAEAKKLKAKDATGKEIRWSPGTHASCLIPLAVIVVFCLVRACEARMLCHMPP